MLSELPLLSLLARTGNQYCPPENLIGMVPVLHRQKHIRPHEKPQLILRMLHAQLAQGIHRIAGAGAAQLRVQGLGLGAQLGTGQGRHFQAVGGLGAALGQGLVGRRGRRDKAELIQPQGVQRMVDIEAKKAEGKGIGYQRWASNFNLKQMASSLNLYTEYGFSSPEELDAAVSAAYAAVLESSAKLKPIELALKEKKELRRQIIIYRNTKAVRDGLAAQKTPKARAAYRQEHEGDLLLSEATIRFFKANGITKLPTVKELTAEIEALMSEKNAGYNEYQERKREADELLTVKRNIDQVLHGAPSQRRDEHDR
mgnify:CR=1 FL=1